MPCSPFTHVPRIVKSAALVTFLLILGIFSAYIWNIPENIFRATDALQEADRSSTGKSTAENFPAVSENESWRNNITEGKSPNITANKGGSSNPAQTKGNGYKSTADSNVYYTTSANAAATNETSLLLTIVHDKGRLGNRMFEYAAVLGLGNMTGRRAFVNPYRSDPDLAKLFQLSRVEDRTVDRSWAEIEETKYAYFDPVLRNLPPRNVKLTGYVQSWKYFDRVRDTVRKEFTFLPNIRADVDKYKTDILKKVNMTDPVLVGVHVRKKDGYSQPNTLEAPKSFFANAMEKIRSLLKGFDVVFLVAGNNMEWCQDNFNETDVVVLPPLPTEVHFAILSSCQHGIVSVGSFGWWMAWLTGGQVVFYKKFPAPNSHEYKGFVYEDYYPPHWIPVDD